MKWLTGSSNPDVLYKLLLIYAVAFITPVLLVMNCPANMSVESVEGCVVEIGFIRSLSEFVTGILLLSLMAAGIPIILYIIGVLKFAKYIVNPNAEDLSIRRVRDKRIILIVLFVIGGMFVIGLPYYIGYIIIIPYAYWGYGLVNKYTRKIDEYQLTNVITQEDKPKRQSGLKTLLFWVGLILLTPLVIGFISSIL